jgi:protein TonB
VSLSPYTPEAPGQRLQRWLAGFGALGLLLLGLAWAASQPLVVQKTEHWMEVMVTRPPPPPPPPPEPPKPAEPPKPKPKPKAVQFDEMKLKPPPDQPPPPVEPPKPVRRVQGLSASSFAPGSGTNLAVNAGNTVQVAASKDKMNLDEANGPLVARSYTAVSKLPRLIYAPQMVVPPDAQKNHIAGVMPVHVDIDDKGRVTAVHVESDLGFGTKEACENAWKASKWKPGEQDGVPVPVRGIPDSCMVAMTQ